MVGWFQFFQEKFFRTNETKLDVIASGIAIMVDVYLLPIRFNSPQKELPEKMLDDRFFLGYVWGLAKAGAYCSGVAEKDHAIVILGVFDTLFFGGATAKIVKQCLEWMSKNDETFNNAKLTAIDESVMIFKAAMAKDEKALTEAYGTLRSLELHIRQNYLNKDGEATSR